MRLPPRHRTSEFAEEGEHLNVLVPGIMGIGFLISLFMLAFDAIEKVLPMVGRRRAAELHRLAAGRSNDLESIWDGTRPKVGVVLRTPRGRFLSLILAAGAFTGAVLAVRFGFDLAGETGSDRQAWAAIVGLIVAAALVAPGVFWLLAAITGPKAPRWLRWLHQFWPLGALPDLSAEAQPRSS